jgi:hypothetical protein
MSQNNNFADLAASLVQLERPLVIAVDGRSASGKSTFAQHLAHEMNCPTVHTDDLAWNHSFFDWWPLLIDNVLKPFLAGNNVAWKPAAWTEHGRDGMIEIAAGPALLIEGVGSSRQELTEWINIVIWIETSASLAEQRGLVRDGPEARDFWFEWQRTERPFLANDRPWERATVVVDGNSDELSYWLRTT